MEADVNTNEKEQNERFSGCELSEAARQECERSRLWEFASAYLSKTGTSEITGGASTGDSIK
jgi:hypothetical protein